MIFYRDYSPYVETILQNRIVCETDGKKSIMWRFEGGPLLPSTAAATAHSPNPSFMAKYSAS